MLRVLHITSWYPSKFNSKEALWIKNHIDLLEEYASKNEVFHLNISKGKFQFNIGLKCVVIVLPFLPWRLSEMVSGFFLFLIFSFKRVSHNYDIVNFHIAYPNLTYWHIIKKWFGLKVIITEHWSAYHDNFGLSISRLLPRVQRIFQQEIPVLAVSKALIDDISNFSDANFSYYVVPNVVDVNVFHRKHEIERNPHRFFMVSQWKAPKDPFIILKSFAEFLKDFPDANLRIGGYGPQEDEMKSLAQELGISSNLNWLGIMDSEGIAIEMNKAGAFIHCSGYETFSVVCAEAIHCGCPVIASNVGGIREFISSQNGILVNENEPQAFLKAMRTISTSEMKLEEAKEFSPSVIGKKYFKVLSEIKG